MTTTFKIIGEVYPVEGTTPAEFGFMLTVEGMRNIEDARRFSVHMRAIVDSYFEQFLPDAKVVQSSDAGITPPWKTKQ